ncbi:MAG: glycosyltransferase family 2 protein [Parabacteroides sp.]|nr:glycosyltransferase family 2 protein [Parabacteroides sp.]MDD3508461.1 glycosyltransferase family 2 protein [Parabacteroides sp.]
MNYSPKISIITATYNSEKTLSETIESILKQTYKNIEYIIIDGNSKDSTINIIQKYEKQFEGKLKWISEPDKGIYDAWNKGIAISTGEWICFIGSDDTFYPSALQEYINLIIENPESNFISSKIRFVDKNMNTIKIIGKPWSKKMLSYCVIAHPGSMHSRSLFNKYGNYSLEYNIASDYDFLLRCYNDIHYSFLPQTTVNMKDGGVSNTNVWLAFKEVRKIKISNKKRNHIIAKFEYYKSIFNYSIKSNLHLSKLNKLLNKNKI